MDLTGEVIGELIVVSPAEKVGGRTAWKCRCVCVRLTVVKTMDLRLGGKNCGCGGSMSLPAQRLLFNAQRKPYRAKSSVVQVIDGVESKWCSGCGKWRPIEAFSPRLKRRSEAGVSTGLKGTRFRRFGGGHSEENAGFGRINMAAGAHNLLTQHQKGCEKLMQRGHCRFRLFLSQCFQRVQPGGSGMQGHNSHQTQSPPPAITHRQTSRNLWAGCRRARSQAAV